VSWTEPKIGDKFRVCVFIVDDTYWDDGNRTTSRDHDFAELSEAYKFLTEARKRGWYETTSWETRQKLRRHLNHDDFILYLHTAEGWRRIDDDEILTLLSLL
jgi:hypothetical protein